jgi:hypothetical protein
MAAFSQDPVEGYPKLGVSYGENSESSIFRRFGNLNSQNLLHLQAELTHLEGRLHRLEVKDFASAEGHSSLYSKDWYWLHNSKFENNHEQWETILKIRGKLSKYSKFVCLFIHSPRANSSIDQAVLQQSLMGQLPNPSSENLRSLQPWLERPKMGNSALIGKDRDSWGVSSEPINSHHDLLSVIPNKEKDKFSAWFSQNCLRSFYQLIWHRVKNHKDLESGVLFYQNDTLQRFTSYFATITAFFAAYCGDCRVVQRRVHKGTTWYCGTFDSHFASCLSIFTHAARSEKFIATSTWVSLQFSVHKTLNGYRFAAVQVVFISASNGLNITST